MRVDREGTPVSRFRKIFAEMPLIAILRGVRPEEAPAIAETIHDAGIKIIEIPLNSPDAFRSIKAVASALSGRAVIGAGTVLKTSDVDQVFEAQGELIVSPNTNPDVIRRTKALNLVSVPGIMTPSEAFSALHAGADVLKLFPGEIVTLSFAKAIVAVLPENTCLVQVGGVTAETIAAFAGSPIAGFGIGSSLYKPGMSAALADERGRHFVKAMREAGFGRKDQAAASKAARR